MGGTAPPSPAGEAPGMGGRGGWRGAVWTSWGANPCLQQEKVWPGRGSSHSQGIDSTGTRLRDLHIRPTTWGGRFSSAPRLTDEETEAQRAARPRPGHRAGGVAAPAQRRPLCSNWRASWAKEGGAGLQKKMQVWGGHSGPREQQEQRQGGMKGQGECKEWQDAEGGRTQGCGDIRGSQLGTVRPAPTTGIWKSQEAVGVSMTTTWADDHACSVLMLTQCPATS